MGTSELTFDAAPPWHGMRRVAQIPCTTPLVTARHPAPPVSIRPLARVVDNGNQMTDIGNHSTDEPAAAIARP
jgi:hypothetical protein